MIFLQLNLNFSSFGVGVGWFWGGFWEGLGKVGAGFVKVLGGFGGSWREDGFRLDFGGVWTGSGEGLEGSRAVIFHVLWLLAPLW